MASYIADAAVYEQEKESRMSARRFNKHIAERKRRARINTALDELKSMILGNMHKDPEEFEKMEKADILDLTVKFLRAAQQPKKAAPVKPQVVQTAAYQAGYNQSLNQVQRFVGASDLDHATAARLAAHLKARSMMTSQPRLIQPIAVKRCDPSPRLCRNISREISHFAPSPAKFATTESLTSSFSSLHTSAKCHPAVSHRAGPAHRAVSVWRPWEGQVSA